MEARALKLFNKMPHEVDETKSNFTELLSVLKRNKAIRIGYVWGWNEADHILIMDDFGPVQTMTKWLLSEKTKSSSNESMIALAQRYGTELANFLLDMQISSLPCVEQLEPMFRDAELHESMTAMVLDTFGKLSGVDSSIDGNELMAIFGRCFQYDESLAPTDGKVLSHGDFNAPNILVDEGNSTLAILDWELARVQSPAHDLSLFLARARIQLVSHPNELTPNFINAFMDTYRESATKKGVSWYTNERQQYVFAWYLGVVLGAAMLQWSLTEPCCGPPYALCDHKRTLFGIAIDYMKRCQLGPEKVTYDAMAQDQFAGRFLKASHTN
jgi:thiamine kinase-like enzyme